MKKADSYRGRLASVDGDSSDSGRSAPRCVSKLQSRDDLRSSSGEALLEGYVLKLPVRATGLAAFSGFRRRHLRLVPPDTLEWADEAGNGEYA